MKENDKEYERVFLRNTQIGYNLWKSAVKIPIHIVKRYLALFVKTVPLRRKSNPME